MPDQNWHSSNSISADATTLPLPLQGKFESDFEDRLYLRIRAEPHHRRNPADHCWLAGSLRRLTLLHLKIPKNMKKASKRGGFKIHGGRRGIRTLDTRIFSPLLYQLSYPTSMYRRMFTTQLLLYYRHFFGQAIHRTYTVNAMKRNYFLESSSIKAGTTSNTSPTMQ